MYNSFSDSELRTRYQRYAQIVAGRDTVQLEELSRRSGTPYSTVLRDLQRILQRNWFEDGAYINYLSKTLVIRVPEAGSTGNYRSGGINSNGSYRYSYVAPTAPHTPAAPKRPTVYSTPSAGNGAIMLPKTRDLGKGWSTALLISGTISAIAALSLLGETVDMLSWAGSFSWIIESAINTMLWGGASIASFVGRAAIKKRNHRMRSYRMIQAGREIVPLEEFARANDVPVETVKKDLVRMIDAGQWGKTAYIDSASGTLRLKYDPALYAAPEPQPTPAAYTPPEPASQPAPAQPASRPASGDEYTDILREIRQLNDSIADAAVSDKISQIEEITGKIFKIVAEKPEKKSEIKSFMSYYLPTTLKLLRSYSTFEKQGVSGENIETAKGDIERILDTLVTGFTQQLDQLFKTDALDISTDIEVLEQMMKKDGLAESGGDFGAFGLGGV